MTEQIVVVAGIDTEAVFVFLDQLRESGVTNMFGSGPYIQDEFGCTKKEATKLFIAWTEAFSERHGI